MTEITALLPPLVPQIAVVQGASRGLGLAFARLLAEGGARVFATCRRPDRAEALAALAQRHADLTVLPLDVTDESSIVMAARAVAREVPCVDLVLNCAGLLHADDQQPERRLRAVRPELFARSFAVNAIGPLLVARELEPLLMRSANGLFAALSARVGSIADNRLGGWYAYRASKAALNMLVKTLSIEWARHTPPITCLALHPGTVATDLSKPFLNGSERRVFAPEVAARRLLAIVGAATPAQTGSLVAWNGETLPW
jgi:NAD(P)-dependent dehydrogenase (short-subunit alcohol dehydrogenase family)